MWTSESLKQAALEELREAVREVAEPVPGQIYLTIDPALVQSVARKVFEEWKARFIISVGTDLREKKGCLEALHIFSLDEDKLFLTLRMEVDPERPELDSITPIIPGAGWAERELQDVMGIRVRGHPDPRRLLLPDDWPEGIHPLRRDVPHNVRPPSDPSARPPRKPAPEGTTVVPVGPFFPVLEEPSYWRLFVQGETIVGCDYRGFYNHRGIEKLGDSVMTYNQIPFLAERICGICGDIHGTCYVEATERALGIRPPRRARLVRSFLLELERVHSHLLWLGIAGHILGFDTVLMQSWRIREPVMWLAEQLTGNRKTYGVNVVGGVRWDVPNDLHETILDVLKKVEAETLEVIDAIQDDTPLLMRIKGVGILPTEVARAFCVVGPTARGSNVPIDARVDHPYAAYDELVPDKKVHDGCDILARVMVRMEETLDSIRLLREALPKLREEPEGDLRVPIEEEIPPDLEGICVVEAPRGEAIHYVRTGGDNRPYRWRVRAPTYANLQAVPSMIQGALLADVPIALGSFDPCFSCTERVEVVDLSSGATRVYTERELWELSRRGKR